jgi:GDPmannose 4,6-dehydratase
VVKGAVDIKRGKAKSLALGNLEATRDWGHAKDYVKAMWMMLQQDNPDNFVCATGVSHSVRDLVDYVFSQLELDYNDHITQDEKFLRPEELTDLKGDSTKLRTTLDWQPDYTFETMIDEMVEYWLTHE